MQTNEILKQMIAERNRLNGAINALLPGTPEAQQAGMAEQEPRRARSRVDVETTVETPIPPNGRVKGAMSTEARAAIGAAQRKRWASYRLQVAKHAKKHANR